MTQTILSLIKMGTEKNMMNLLINGEIYLNPIDYFRKHEDDQLRGDPYEGGMEILNITGGTFNLAGIDREFSYEHLHALVKDHSIVGNLYCLYSISSFHYQNPIDFKFDSRNCDFGTHCVLIKNLPIFFDLIDRAMVNSNLKYTSGFVKYYDKNNTTKKLSIFDKPSNYSYQNEFRFYIQSEINEPIVLNIGNLEGIAEMYKIADLIDLKLHSPSIKK